jgi:hypothetical protein
MPPSRRTFRCFSNTLMSYLVCLLITASACATQHTQAEKPASEIIRYPSAGENFIRHHSYPIALLKLAIAQSGNNLELVPSKKFMHQGRALKQLQAGKDIEVLWTMTSKEREGELTPIRIPIYKGLIGWRVFLSSNPNILGANKALTLEQIKSLETIQGHDWPDTHILARNGFNIQNSPSYAGLFSMIALQRADLFPRSVIEVWDELKQFESQGVGLEAHTIISYPTASYFFVSPHNKALAIRIEEGLLEAIKSGSFERLFNQHFAAAIEKTAVSRRTHYRLNNPLLPDKTPLHNNALWFTPE